MKLIDKYLTKALLTPLFYVLSGFTMIYLVLDLVDKLSDFIEGGMGLKEVLHYYALEMPAFIITIIPVCLLLATLYALFRLTRHSEIIAMRASGISIYRLTGPFIIAGLIGTGLTHYINEVVVPRNAYRAAQFLRYHKTEENRKEEVYTARGVDVRIQKRNRDWHITKFNTRDYSMDGVTVNQYHPDTGERTLYTAERVERADGRWWFFNVREQTFDREGNLKGQAAIEKVREMKQISERPLVFMAEVKTPEFMSSSELRKYLRRNPELSQNVVNRKMVDMHHKLAQPTVCLLAVMLGIPLGAGTGRRGVLAGIMTIFALFFSFFGLQMMLEALAKSGNLNAAAAVWSPLAIYLIISMALIHRMR